MTDFSLRLARVVPHLKRSLLSGLLLFLMVSSIACFGGGSRPEREQGSAVWVEAGRSLEPTLQRQLGEAGIGGLFVPFGLLEGPAETAEITSLELPDLPRRTAVTAVVSGEWQSPPGEEDEAGEGFGREVQRFLLRIQGPGTTIAGLHFDLRCDAEDLPAYAAALESLRRDLPESLFLSAGLQLDWLGLEETVEVARGVDFLVAWVYGRRPQVDDQVAGDRVWDLQGVDQALDQLEAMGVDYLLGIATLGSAWKLSTEGREQGFTHRGGLRDLALNDDFRLESSFVLTGLDTRRYDFRALGPTQFGPWKVARGETVRVEGLTPGHLREYHRRLASRDLDHYLGDLYFRLPTSEESFSLPASALLEGLQEEVLATGLQLEVEMSKQTSRRWTFRLKLRNPGDRATEVGFIESNFLELTGQPGVFRSVDPGDFRRYRLLEPTSDGFKASLRRASVVRLYHPILAAGEEISTGTIDFRPSRSGASIQFRSEFLMPEGTPLEVEPTSWPVVAPQEDE